MKRASLTLAATAVLAAPVAGASQETCTVARIIDGDTFVCSGGTRGRLLLMDAPEMDQGDYGLRAQEELERLLPIGRDVQLETDVQRTDRYGRLLAYVYAPTGTMANEEMVRRGFAVVSVYPPNVRYVDQFRELQAEARAQRRGLWSVDAFDCLPADRRRGACEPAGYAGGGLPPTRRSRIAVAKPTRCEAPRQLGTARVGCVQLVSQRP